MSKIYCGVDAVPKKSRRGTPEECVKKKQVRYYGIEEIDRKLLTKNKDSLSNTREKLIVELSKEKGLINRYEGRYKNAPKSIDKKKLEEYYKRWKSAEKRYASLLVKFRKIEKMREQEKEKEKLKKSAKKKSKSGTKTKSK